MKTVYIGISSEFMHPGILNIIKESKKMGSIIGLFTDRAIASYQVFLI